MTREERLVCCVCSEVILPLDVVVELDFGDAHEHCADPEDAEAAIAAGNYEPGEDYPHGDY